MTNATDRLSGYDEIIQSDKAADQYKELTAIMVISVLFLMIFLPFRFGRFWIFGNGLFNVIDGQTIGFFAIFVAAVAVGVLFFKDSFFPFAVKNC